MGSPVSKSTLLYMFGVVLVVALLAHPLVVTRHVPVIVVQHDTVALRVDSVRVLERPAAFGDCALPATVTAVLTPEHRGGRDPVAHGHYSIATGYDKIEVDATPMDAKPGDVVCVRGPL